MIRKILAINGGGIIDIAFLTYMLKISKHYDKKNIDLLSLFNTFSGVSSGSIIACAFALREKCLQNIAKRNPHAIISALKKINAEYSKNEMLNIIKNLKKMKVINCSSIVIATLIVFFELESSNIFNRSTFRKIASINGLLFSKYDDNKSNILDKYFDFKLKDVPVERTLVIKSINVKKIKVQIYTNYVTSEKNDFLISDPHQSVSQALDFSTNAPTYFPFNKMIDGGTILNTSLLEQIFIFKNDDLVIFKLNNILKPSIKKNIVFDGILGWAYPLIKVGLADGYENEIFKELLKFKYQEKIHISDFDFTKYSLDDINKISEIENIGKKKSVKSALKFIDNILMGYAANLVDLNTSCSSNDKLIAKVAKRLEKSVVVIFTTVSDDFGNELSTGTGVVLTSNGEILTNAHVIKDASKVVVRFAGESEPRVAKIIASDLGNDLALIKVDATGLTAATFAKPGSVKVGDAVVAIGYALSLDGGPTVTSGIVSALNRTAAVKNDSSVVLNKLIQTDAAISSGNSGGPLVNLKGEVVGINTLVIQVIQGNSELAANNIGFSISVDEVLIVIERLREKANGIERKEGSLGVQPAARDDGYQGVIITKVQPGLPADKAGIKKGDVVLSVDGEPIYSPVVLATVIREANPGQTVKIEIFRDGKRIVLKATLVARSEDPLMRSGLVLTHIDHAIRPQDDLYRFMNGKWLTESKIPEDRSGDGVFYELNEYVEKQVKQIIIDQANVAGGIGSNAQKIGDLYNSFMDEKKIEELGITPIAEDLTAAQGFNTKDEFIQLLGELNSNGLFNLYIDTDKKEATKYIGYLGQSGLSLPDEAYYREDKYKEIRDSFIIHVKNMFELAGLKDAQSCATSVLELETQIAAYHWDVVKNRDADLTYNKKSFTQLSELCPAFNWPIWMKSSETPEHVLTQVIVTQPPYFEGLSKLLENFEVDKWRCWLTWQILSGATPYLNSALVNERFNFYGTTLYGVPKLRERWKRAIGLVETAIDQAVGQIYVERHFSKDAKERIVDLVKNLTHAYRENIDALDWMSDDTKKKALLKLDKFTSKIGYPDKWRDYSKLSITPGDLIGNVDAIARYSQDYAYSKIGKEVDKSEWLTITPQTVNAQYNPGANEIIFPAAILQPPFFDVLADDAANYGGIGAIIGHEMGHGFDDQGSKYDGDGNLVNWWNVYDRAEFEKLASMLIKQYDQLSPENAPDIKVNGALTVGENIADLGGLAIAYKAYKISLNGKEPPVIDGYSGVQRFFMGWAQCWRAKYRPETIRRKVATDPHSPEEFRCNQIVSNMTEFYHAFAVTQNDKLFMAESERVRIW